MEDEIPHPQPTIWSMYLVTLLIVVPTLLCIGWVIGGAVFGAVLDASTYSYDRCDIYQINESSPTVLEDAHKHFCDFNGTAWYFNQTRFSSIWSQAYTNLWS